MKIRGYLLLLAAASMWGALGPVARQAFAEGLSPLEVAFWRAAIAAVCFGLHAVTARQAFPARKDLPLIVFFALTGVTLFYSSYQLAVQRGGAALAAVLLYTAPAWVAVMSRIFFKEAMGYKKITALAATLAGVTIISLSGGDLQVTPSAILWGLLAGFAYSLYYIFGKYFQPRYSAANLFFYLQVIGAAGLWTFVDFVTKSTTAWFCLAFLALISTYGAYYCYYTGLKYLEPTQAAITATLEPVIAAFVAFLWWGELFTWQGYVGSGLILISVLVMVVDGARRRHF